MTRSAVLACVVLLLSATWSPAPCCADDSALITFANGNWEGDACTAGGLDVGAPGDAGCVVVSGQNDGGYAPSFEVEVTLDKDLSGLPQAPCAIGYRSNDMQTPDAAVYWDGVLLSRIDARGQGESLKEVRFTVDPKKVPLTKGVHKVKVTANRSESKWDLFELDAIQFNAKPPSNAIKGALIPFQLFPLQNANWKGDGYTWGGLDAAESMEADTSTAIVAVKSTNPASLDVPVTLEADLSQTDVRVTVGVRRNGGQVAEGSVLWDGKPLLVCHPLYQGERRATELDTESIVVKKGALDFTPGQHTLRFAVDEKTQAAGASFQVDAILLEGIPAAFQGTMIALDDCTFDTGKADGIVNEAFSHFAQRARALGAKELRLGSGGANWAVRVGLVDSGSTPVVPSGQVMKDTAGLKPFQQKECYWLTGTSSKSGGTVGAVGTQALGAVHAISELEQRLRVKDGQVFLAFEEWAPGAASWTLFDKPAIEDRGEYINIGYNYANITPHEWTQERWHAYLDKIVLAKLNTFYFYLWNDTYTMYPGSELSKRPLNRQIHENIKDAISYAHRRGLKVVYMACPTYFPKDIWDKHPEMHSEIEYVGFGFPAACQNAPGAWDLMKDMARSEFDWFKEADAIQLWFYDPGGCWCEKNGCKANQAVSLVRQVKEFGGMFREMNPKASVEVNFWPMWLWEPTLKIQYRDQFDELLKKELGPATNITMVGAPDSKDTQPRLEQTKGYRTGIFIFGTNPERSYVFTIPLLRFTKHVANEVRAQGFDAAFGHRLEAWTRYPGTYFMSQFLWNPDAKAEDIVRKFADWQTADSDAGLKLAEALMLLERFSDTGATPELGARMQNLVTEACAKLPEPCRVDLQYFPPMFDALAVLGKASRVDDNGALQSLAADFKQVLAGSQDFRCIAPVSNQQFREYLTSLKKGWAKEIF